MAFWDNRRRVSPDQSVQPDWRATAPGIELRWLVVAAVAMPLLLAAGVYWLHRLPPGPNIRGDDNLVEVRLIGPQGPASNNQEQPQTKSAEQTSTERPPEIAPQPVMQTAAIHDPEIIEAPVPAPTQRARASAPPVSRLSLDQKSAAFQRTLLSHIARFRQYPNEAKRLRTQGVVRLIFAMRRDGSVNQMTVATSSGSVILDEAAIATVRRAEPLPRIPAELPDNLNISVPVAFDLSY
ncbi:hypothetical protein I8G32_01377 [Rhodopseudomonas palustris]|uniref:Energy transducer TonB n=1 Tax=Rhodopseudomonas palustris (strain ATCC BAA-98 / CGA009) TaxID=258594 RepID=Q6NA40_RHOPA|nr:energy transducer TonB [Rhodopseudomonas palustris]OPF91401.1 energy transducer TonB [Rhodopseudomonas palustris]QQM02842.1 hypothetical protein I8G32_01377 [Rhodopseudomonas palustris]RJF60439.1 energy transducer TonB [Rhodopseudomonas palustris]WAB79019.1 energy transducer TonB [Rhodopseudomonas palustris]WCL91481.1 energy transducer TonB [Rhodopseudomonas palustris CGA009]